MYKYKKVFKNINNQKLIWQNVSRHPAKHVNLKSNTIMKKPRDKYKKEFKIIQTFYIKNQKIFAYVKTKPKSNIR